MNEKGIATLIRGDLPGFVGHASLYGVLPGVAYDADVVPLREPSNSPQSMTDPLSSAGKMKVSLMR
jgi:hypothetical protein